MPYLSIGPLGAVGHAIARALSSRALIPLSCRGLSVADPTAVGSLLTIGIDRVHRLLGKIVIEEKALKAFTRTIDSNHLKVLIKNGILEVDKLPEGYEKLCRDLLRDHGLLEHESRTMLLGLRHDALTVFGDPLAKQIASDLIEKKGVGVRVVTPVELAYIAYMVGLIGKVEFEALRKMLLRGPPPWDLQFTWCDRAEEQLAARIEVGVLW